MDTHAAEIADGAGWKVQAFPADWERYGRAAGNVRNGDMAFEAEALVAFPGERGTANMIEQMERRGKLVVKLPAESVLEVW